MSGELLWWHQRDTSMTIHHWSLLINVVPALLIDCHGAGTLPPSIWTIWTFQSSTSCEGPTTLREYWFLMFSVFSIWVEKENYFWEKIHFNTNWGFQSLWEDWSVKWSSKKTEDDEQGRRQKGKTLMMIMLVLLLMMTRGIQEERVPIERPVLVHLVTTTRPLLQPLKISVVPFFSNEK